MHAQRLLDNLEANHQISIDKIFGNPILFDSVYTVPPFEKIKRVAILAEAFLPKVDGVSKTTYLTLRYLQETGREVLVFAPDLSIDSVGASKVIPLPSVGIPAAPETRMALPNPAVARYLHEFKPDLIHLFSPAAMSVNGMAMGRHLGIPVIANYQTDLPGYSEQYGYPLLSRPISWWLRYIHNGCHLTLAPTRTIINQLKSEGFRRIRHWGRGVNSVRFHPQHATSEMRARLLNGRDPNSLLCIYVGRLANEKRIDLLLDVAKLQGVALTIIGDGALRDELEQQFAGTDTHFTGYLVGDELAEAYASADVFVFTGANETFGQVIQEAMASGLPSVVINAGGAPDILEDGITGLIVEPSRQAFAQAIIRLRNNSALRMQLSTNARSTAEKRPWSALMAQIEGYYAEAYTMNERFKQLFGSTTYHLPVPSGRIFRPRPHAS